MDSGRRQGLREGRILHVAKGSGCHSLPAPARFDDVKRPRAVQEMAVSKKVRRSPLERDRIVTNLIWGNDLF